MEYASKKVFWLLLTGVFMLLPDPSFSEFYKYRDQNGAIRFTDDLSQIPVEHRPKVQNYSEIEDFSPPARQRRSNVNAAKKKLENGKSASRETPEQWAARLRERKGSLEEEYEKIIQTQKDLKSRRTTLNTPASYREYHQKKARLQDRAAFYEKERKRFEEEVETYNEVLGSRRPLE